MSVVQIPNLGAAIALNGTEQLEGVQAGTSVKLTVAQLGAYITAQYPPPGVSSVATSAPITGGTITTTGTIGLAGAGVTNAYLATMSAGTVKANVTGGSAQPTDATPSGVLDIVGSATGDTLYRGAGNWTALAIGTPNYILSTNGVTPQWVDFDSLHTLTVGTTPISNGATGRVLYDNGGLLGEYSVTGTAGSVVLSTGPTLSAPQFSTIVNAGTLTLPTATDTLVARATADALTNKTISGSTNTISNIANASLTNSSVTFNGVTVALGASGVITATAASVTVGSTTVLGGTSGYVLYDNVGVVGELATTGSGSVVRASSPTLVTPVLGTVAAGSVLTNATGLPLTTGVTGTLPAANGGTAQSTYATGDTLYASALNTLSKLTIGSSGQVLTVAAGIPSWATLSTSAVTTFSAGTTGFTPSTATSGAITLAGTLAVANGGTGVTSSTGTGSVVLSASPTLTGTLTYTGSRFVTGIDGSNTFWIKNSAGSEPSNLSIGYTTNGSGTVSSVTINAALVYGGVTLANSVTGTGSMVLSASPTLTGTLTVPAITASGLVSVGTLGVGTTSVAGGVADFKTAANKHLSIRQASDLGGGATAVMIEAYNDGAAALIPLEIEASTVKINPIVGGAITLSGATTMSNALNYGGVTLSNSVTGTGSMVLSASPTLTGTLTAAAANFGAVGSVVQVAVGMQNSFARLRERNSVNQVSLTTNISLAGVQDDATKVSWEATMGGVADSFQINRAPAGGALAQVFLVGSGGQLTLGGALTYGGITLSNSVTGTGSMVLSASPTFTGTGVTINNGTTARLLVGTTNADAMFEVYSPNGSATACPIIAHDGVTSGGLQFAQFRYGAGSGTVVGSITGNTSGTTAYNTSSDIRLKTNFAPATSASKIIDAIAVEEFDWKSSGERQRYGMVAQRLVEVYPEAVWQGTKDGDMWAVDYSKLVPVMVKEIQELRSRVKALEA